MKRSGCGSRYYCSHCQQWLSKTTYYKHKQEFVDNSSAAETFSRGSDFCKRFHLDDLGSGKEVAAEEMMPTNDEGKLTQ